MKPIMIVAHPLHLDYPIFRYNLIRFKNYFDEIYISFSDHHVVNYNLSNYVRSQLPFCKFIEPKRTRRDWRNDAVNNVLDEIKSDNPIIFYEQDFLIADNSFFDKLLEKDHDFIYYKEGYRIHPAFALVKREIIEKTSKDFSAFPPGDHFYKFFQEAGKGDDLESLGLVNKKDFYHMAGISQNYMNFSYGDPFFKPNNFLYYNFKNIQYPTHPSFFITETKIEELYGHSPKHSFLDLFFPEYFPNGS